MDDRLKQRLWGASVAVALAVIFVPMLFDEKGEDFGDINATNVPPLPPEAQEREILLPAMPDEGKPAESVGRSGETRERAGYRIIPLDDAPAPGTGNPPPTPVAEGHKDEAPTEFEADEGGAPDELPTRDSPLAKMPRTPPTSPEATGILDEGPTRSAAAKSPPAKDTRPAAAARPEPALEAPAKPVAPVRPRAAPGVHSPPVPKRAAPAGKTSEKSATAVKSPERKPPVAQKPSPAPRPKVADVGAPVTKAAKVAEMPKLAETGRSAPEPAKSAPALNKPAESKAITRLDAGGSTLQSKQESAEVAKSAAARNKPPDVKPEAVPKKRPDALASAAASPSAGSAAKSPVSVAPKTVADPKATSPAPNKSKPSGSSGSWVIRAGSYTSESGAKALVERLRKQKFAAYLQKVSGDNGIIYRVQVGPELEKSRAEQTLKRLETGAGIHGTLVSHR